MDKSLLIMGTTAVLMNLANSTFASPICHSPILISSNIGIDPYNQPIRYVYESERIFNRLNEFSKLEENWNGYGAIKLLPVTIDNTKLVISKIKEKFLKLLDVEDIVPSSYGTISIYFEDTKNNELSIEFGKDSIGLSGEIDGQEIIVDDVPMHNFDIVLDYIDKLTPFAK